MFKSIFKNLSLKISAITLLIVVASILNGCSDNGLPSSGLGVSNESLRFVFMAAAVVTHLPIR